MQDIKKKIDNISVQILSKEEIENSEKLLEEIKSINLDNNSILLAYFRYADTKDISIRKLLSENFGENIIKNIELFQRIGKISLPKGQKGIQTLRNVFIELASDLKIIILKLYDKLVYLKECDKNKSPELSQIASECLNLYSPIAHRLGIRQIYNQMEDIGFRIIYTDDFKKLEKAIERRRPAMEKKLIEMSNTLKELLKKNNIEGKIQYRVKRVYSIFKKLEAQKISVDNIFDLMALRVVTNKVDDCYLALGVVHRNWVSIEKRFRDWVTFPKPNGYRSIQTTIITNKGDKFEIQIRTEEMHREAEYGSAAHWAYKEKINADESWIAKLKEFLENDIYFENPNALDEMLQAESKRSFIHILTPRGEVKTLNEGSTALDFAFSVHTEVGFHATGARINGKFAKTKTVLQSGDVVEIMTNKQAKPSRDWLNWVVSQSAKSKIQLWIKKNEKAEIEAEGKRFWEKFKKMHKHKIQGFDDDQIFRSNINKLGFKSTEDFFSAIGMNSLKPSLAMLRKLYPNAFEKKIKEKITSLKRKSTSTGPKIIIEGIKNIETHLAKCCNPIKGEPIKALITRNSIKVHSANCQYIDDIVNNERIKNANWALGAELQAVKIQILGTDYNQLFTVAIEKAQEDKITILSIDKVQNNKLFEGLEIELEIKDIEQYNEYKRKLNRYSFIKLIK